jgi:glucose-6-phosphate dehydrogenase assembly protein OpcA
MPLVEISRQMVYDSARWHDLRRGFHSVAGLLGTTHPPALVDLAWRRLAPMRRAIAAALEPLHFDERPRPEQVSIATGSNRRAEAWLLWGWLQTRLGWPAATRRTIVSGAAAGGDSLEVHFHGDDWSAEVILSRAGGEGVAATLASIVARDTAGRTVTVSPPHENVAEALSDELTRLSHDLALERIVHSLAGPRPGEQ